MRQLQKVMDKLSLNKASNPDKILNLIFKNTFETMQHYLLAMVRAKLQLGHFLTLFKHTTTLALCKHAKPDYTKPNAYHSIVLENTINKILESIMVETLSYLMETHGLLLPQHFGEHLCRTTEDALTIHIERIYYT